MAWQATGSSTQGRPAACAPRIAARIPSTKGADRVPMFTVSAPAMPANSSASSASETMAGLAPAASNTLAAMFMAT